MSLSIANHTASLPVAYRLYLPKDWAQDGARRDKAGVPLDIGFQTKPELALEQLRWACEAGLPRGVALMDVAYGNDSRLRAGLTVLGLTYVAGIQPNTLMWPSGTGPKRRGKPLNNTGRRDEPDLLSAKEVALGLPKRAWRTIRWREGSADWLSSRFARVRVGVGHNQLIPELLLQEWLLIEWPEGEAEPTKYWLSTLPAIHQLPPPRRPCQAALAYRARLSGTQAGGRARSLRRARMARLPSSRHAVHRGLRIPDLRAGDDSPLRTSFHRALPGACLTRQVIDPEDPPLRPERHIPNSIATMRIRLINALVKTLAAMPCCGATAARYRRRKVMTQ